MIDQSADKYPNFPPFDTQVKFYDGSQLKVNPMGAEKMVKICPRCQFPIQVRVFLRPCMHYLCFDCYQRSKNQCPYCNTVACQVVRIGDREVVYSCDNECFKVIGSAQELSNHQLDHIKIKSETIVTLI